MVRWAHYCRRGLIFSVRHSRWTGALLFVFFIFWRAVRLDFNDKIWRVHPMLGTMMDREVYRSRRVISNLPSLMSLESIRHGLSNHPVDSDEIWRVLLDFSFHSWNFCASTLRLLWTVARWGYQITNTVYPFIRPLVITFWALPRLTKLYILNAITLATLLIYLGQKGYLRRAAKRLRIWHNRVATAVANYGPYILFLSLVHFPLKQTLSLPHFRVLHQNVLFAIAIAYSLLTTIGIVVLRRFQEMRVAYGLVEAPKSMDGSMTRRSDLVRRQIPPGTDLSRPPTGVVVTSTVLGMTTPRGLTNAVTRSRSIPPLEVRKTVLRQAVVHILTFWATLTLLHALFVVPEKLTEILLRAPLPIFSLWSIGSSYTDKARRLILMPTAVLGYEDIIYLRAPAETIPNGVFRGLLAPRLAWLILASHEVITSVLMLSVLLQHDRFGDYVRRIAVDFLEYVVYKAGGLKVVLVNRVRRTRKRQMEKDIIFGDTDSPYAGYLSSTAEDKLPSGDEEDDIAFARSAPFFPTVGSDRSAVPRIPIYRGRDTVEKRRYEAIAADSDEQQQPWLGRKLDFFRGLGGRHVERFLFLFGFLPLQKLKEVVIHALPLCFLLTPSIICRPAFLIIALFIPMLYGLKGLYRRALEKAVYWQTYYTALMLFIGGLDILANSSPIAAWLVFALRPKFAAVLLLLWICTEPDVLGLLVVNTATRVSKHSVQAALSARRATTQPSSECLKDEQENLPCQSAPAIIPECSSGGENSDPHRPLTDDNKAQKRVSKETSCSSREVTSTNERSDFVRDRGREPSRGGRKGGGTVVANKGASSSDRGKALCSALFDATINSLPSAPRAPLEAAELFDVEYEQGHSLPEEKRKELESPDLRANYLQDASQLFQPSEFSSSSRLLRRPRVAKGGVKGNSDGPSRYVREGGGREGGGREGGGREGGGREGGGGEGQSVIEGGGARRSSRRKGTDQSATSTATITSVRESSLSGETPGPKTRSIPPKPSSQRMLRPRKSATKTPPTAVA